jgi:hypothetical protein
MQSRLSKWYSEVSESITDTKIAAGLQNGEIIAPKWLSYSPTTAIGFAVWDNEISNGTTKLIQLNFS